VPVTTLLAALLVTADRQHPAARPEAPFAATNRHRRRKKR
jgi:hypothetical protein